MLSSLPETIGQLKQLEELGATFSNFVYVPESIGALSNLKSLDMGDGEMSCALPVSMEKLVDLERIDTDPRNLQRLPTSVFSSWENIKKLSLRWDVDLFDHPENTDPALCLQGISLWKSIQILEFCIFSSGPDEDGESLDDDENINPLGPNISLLSLGPSLQELRELTVNNGLMNQLELCIQGLNECKKLTSLTIQGCKLFNQAGISTERISLPVLVKLECSNLDAPTDMALFHLFDLPKLKILSMDDCCFDNTDDVDQFFANLISRCNSLKSLSFYGSDIEDISEDACATLPRSVVSLELHRTPLATGRSPDQVETSRECLWRLARTLPNLYDIDGVHWDYYFSEKEKHEYLRTLSWKKAKYFILNNQPVTLSLWPSVFQHADNAFNSDIHTKEDAIYILLKKRYIAEVVAINH